MAESALKRLLVQTSHYSIASVLTMVAGLVTFPVLTRLFSVADYGLMSLIGATLSISVALGKAGVQHSIVRYDSEIRAGKGRFTLSELYATTLFGMIGSALIIALLLVAGTQFTPLGRLGDARLRSLFAIASVLILIQVVESVLVNLLRAEQETASLMKYQVLKKYLGLVIILTAVLFIARDLIAFYAASVLAEGLALLALGWVLFRSGQRPRPTPRRFSRRLYVELLGFGVPMMIGYELSGIVLAVGDRYVIEALIGATPLGLYAAAYNLCQYVQAVFIASVGQAVTPIYTRIWDQEGAGQASAFIARSLRTYVLLGAPVIAGVALVGPELLPSLASEKYASAGSILSWVIAGMVVDGTNAMVGAGLFIHRRTRAIMAIVLGSAVLNIALNVALVPRIGIRGAAISTLISYSATSLAMAFAGRRLLEVPVPWGTLLRAGVAALAMYLLLRDIWPDQRLVTVGVRVLLGAPVYTALIVGLDADARAIAASLLGRLRRRSGGGGT